MTNIDVIELLQIAESIAAAAGEMAADMRTGGVRVQATKSSELDIVTQADTAVEALIRSRLASLRPEDGILGEETGESPGVSGVTWIIDPIDGTVNYLYGSPTYAVSIAATVTNERGRRLGLAGCVTAPNLGHVYTAAFGHPARRDGHEIGVNTEVPLHHALVSTGVPYDLDARAQVLTDVSSLLPRVRDIRVGGSAALDICGVAEGRTDAHAGRNLPIWDYAAAGLIATQAGAVVRGPKRNAPNTELVLVGEAPLADALEPLLTWRSS